MTTTHYREYPYGHDFGNSKTEGVVYFGNEIRQLSMPSAICEGTYEELSSKSNRDNLHNLGVITPQSHILKLKDYEFYIGNLAIEQSPSVEIATLTSRGDITRYRSIKSLAMLLAASGTLIKDQEYGLIVVTGLPILTMSDEYASAIQCALEGDHTFILDGIERTAHVAIRKVIMESSGANIAHGHVGNVKYGTVDIGGGTTDISMNNGLIPITSQCRSFDIGVETAVDAFISAFFKQFNFPLTASDAMKIQCAYISGKGYETIATVRNARASGSAVDTLVKKAMNDVGSRIASSIKRAWTGSLLSDIVASDAESILLIGGGAYYFADMVRSIFPDRLTIPANPECANAMGYARLALCILSKAIRKS